MMDNLLDFIERNKGATISPLTGQPIENQAGGYCVSIQDGAIIANLSIKKINKYLKKARKKKTLLGIWFNTKNKKFYLDFSQIIQDKKEALKVARENKQLAIFDLKNKQDIYL